MSIFDEVLGKATGAQSIPQAQQQDLVQQLLNFLTSKEAGGLQGIIKSFEQNGLGQIISTWVGKGENAAITPDQVEQGLGKDVTRQLADKAGVTPEPAKLTLAQILPLLIDRLTPEGKVPEGGLASEGEKLLRQFMPQQQAP
jgi:uncharacterized protein YidB (DUF937 family)